MARWWNEHGAAGGSALSGLRPTKERNTMFYIYCPHCCEHARKKSFMPQGRHTFRALWDSWCLQPTKSGANTFIFVRTHVESIMNFGSMRRGVVSFSTSHVTLKRMKLKKSTKFGEQPSVVANIAVSSESQNHKAPPKSKPGATTMTQKNRLQNGRPNWIAPKR